jgi:hypothetical protein
MNHLSTFKTVAFLLLAFSVLLNLSPVMAGGSTALKPRAEAENQSDPAQALVRIWTGAWSGNSFGRNNPGEPQPSAPVSGNWILDLQAVDSANNTASGTLTWTGKDAFWTYEILPNGLTIPTPHDFIPNRIIRFDSSNTTLTSPAPGAGPQFHLTIEGFKNAPNPSDAFYGPWFSVDLFPNTGAASSAGNGFSAHPYNSQNFDTAISMGVVTGSTEVCQPGMTIGNVGLPEVTVPFVIPNKPSWHIRYGGLGLNFTTVSPPPNAICEARSNRGSLNVLGAPTSLGPFITFAHSVASATLTTFKGSDVGGLPTCNFFAVSGPRNNCLLNGAFKTNTHYARWHTDGFTTEVNVLHLAGEPNILRTGPLTFWVDINALQLSPATSWMESVVRAAEPFIHRELIDHLPLITTYAIIQDPGKVSLFVVKDGILGTGKSGAGAAVTTIPRSIYYDSDTNPAVILLEPDAGNYKIFVNGVATGEYVLSVSTTKFPGNNTAAASVTGNIIQGNSIVYDLNLTQNAQGIAQSFNSNPVPVPAMQLILAAPPAPSNSAASLNSLLQTRDPFKLVNSTSVITPGSDLRTRVHLFVTYLRLSPVESINNVTVEARDGANVAYAVEVEDVRDVPNTILSQLTVRLAENLPTGLISLRVGLHGQVTEWGTIMIQK